MGSPRIYIALIGMQLLDINPNTFFNIVIDQEFAIKLILDSLQVTKKLSQSVISQKQMKSLPRYQVIDY